MIKVSVVIAVYNVEKFIERCALSLFKQSLDDVEFIFVNDASKDNSVEILYSLQKQYTNLSIKIVSKIKNEGLPKARQTGVENALGEYVYHVDGDDWIQEDGLKMMYDFAKEHDADILCCGYYKDYGWKEEEFLGKPVTSLSNGIDMMLRSEEELHSGVWCKLVRRNIYDSVIFPPSYMHEDLALMIQLFYYARNVCYLPCAFYHYMQTNPDSIIRKDSARRNQSALINFHFIVDFMKRVGIEQHHRNALEHRINNFKIHSLYKGRFLDMNLYSESNHSLLSKEYCKSGLQKIYVFFAMYDCNFFWLLINGSKTIIKRLIGKK